MEADGVGRWASATSKWLTKSLEPRSVSRSWLRDGDEGSEWNRNGGPGELYELGPGGKVMQGRRRRGEGEAEMLTWPNHGRANAGFAGVVMSWHNSGAAERRDTGAIRAASARGTAGAAVADGGAPRARSHSDMAWRQQWAFGQRCSSPKRTASCCHTLCRRAPAHTNNYAHHGAANTGSARQAACFCSPAVPYHRVPSPAGLAFIS